METKIIAMNIRLPAQIWRTIHRLATKHNRSFHGEVLNALNLYIELFQQKDTMEGTVSRETAEEN